MRTATVLGLSTSTTYWTIRPTGVVTFHGGLATMDRTNHRSADHTDRRFGLLRSAIVMATHPQWERAPEVARRFVRYGASPRGAQALVLGAKVRALAEGRYNVSIEDIKAMTAPALRHRVILNFEGEAEGVDTDTLIGQVVEEAEASAIQSREPFLR